MGAVLKKLNSKIMKKLNNKILLLLMAMLSLHTVSGQTLTCNSEVYVGIGADGQAVITPEMVLEGPTAGLSVMIMREGDTLADSIIVDCSDVGDTVVVVIESTTSGNQCWSNLIVEDVKAPTPFCVSLSTAILDDNNTVELYARDFNVGTFENCGGPIAYTFGTWAFDFEPVVIEGVLVNWSVDHYFDQSGPIATVAGASPAVLTDYDNGLIQRWNADVQSSSRIYSTNLSQLVVDANMSVTDESGNSDFCIVQVTLIGDGTSSPGDCFDSVDRYTDPWSCTVDDILPADFISPGIDYHSGEVSKDGINYFDILANPSFGGAGTFPLYVRYVEGTESFSCVVEVNVIDEVPPVVVAESEIAIVLSADDMGVYTATLLPETVDDGSYDQCSDLELSISQTVFTEDDLGDNMVTLTATDASDNFNQAVTIVTVVLPDCSSSLDDLVQWPQSSLYIDNPAQEALELTPAVLMSDYGFTATQVMPTFDQASCDNIAVTFFDQVFTTATGWKLIRTWTSINWITAEVDEYVQIINNGPFTDVLACVSELTVVVELGGTVQIFAEDLLVGYTGNSTELLLVITDPDGNVLPDNIITTSYEGIPLTYTVTNSITGNSCWGSMSVHIGNTTACTFDPVEDINWPLEQIFISDDAVMASELVPSFLSSEYEYTLPEVEVILNDTDCIVGFNYEDTVIELGTTGSPYFKIIRTWSVVVWDTGEFYSFVQVITNTVDPTVFICDSLSRLAPLGDCDSGHTDTDDVEWPEDIIVSDHRITPIQLTTISGVDELDAQPSFYNEPSLYASTYVDVLTDLTTTQIFLDRNWTVTREDGNGLSWTYTQEVTVDFADFENLVTVTTPKGYALSGVEVNSTFSTGMDGSVLLADQEVQSLFKAGDFLDGVDVFDVILLRQGILGEIELTDNQLLAGDVNGDGSVTSIDMIEIVRTIIGQQPDLGVEWLFVDETSTIASGLRPKGAYVGVKPGDLDDSYGTTSASVEQGDELLYRDILLNAGETYEVDIHFNQDVEIYGADIKYSIASDDLEIQNISSPLDVEVSWHRDEFGLLSIVVVASDGVALDIADDEPLLSIELVSQMNGILSEQFQISEDEPSFYLDAKYDRIAIGGSVEGVILDVFDDPANALSFVNVYPNPATDYVVFDLPAELLSHATITLTDAAGRIVASAYGQSQMDVSQLSTGLYMYTITSGNKVFHQKLLVQRY